MVQVKLMPLDEHPSCLHPRFGYEASSRSTSLFVFLSLSSPTYHTVALLLSVRSSLIASFLLLLTYIHLRPVCLSVSLGASFQRNLAFELFESEGLESFE